MPQGLFIVLDGPDGCGKSTQAALLVDRLKAAGRTVVHLREPGGTPAGEKIRGILLDPAVTLGTAAETFLFMAARAELAPVIRDAVGRGGDVVCERWISSTIAYQGVAGGFGAENVAALGKHAIGALTPAILILLDLPPEEGLARVRRGLDRMEQKGIAYHRKVREGYLEARSMFPRAALVDASRQPDQVAAEIGSLVEALL
ncbi:MAG: dTMP kinase [Candidatus Brocadiae bacterium]|nr:dTMP kinase [Candidatus Brocadiia bacterium]